MSDRISAAQLAEIEKRANEATTGPWRHHIGDSETGADWHSVDYDDPSLQFGYDHICNGIEAEDAAFIAAARSDVPALVNALREAWGEAEAATRSLAELVNRCEHCDGSGVHHWYRNGVPLGAHECEECSPCDWCGPARALVGSENRSAPEETHRIECRECDAVAVLDVHGGFVIEFSPLDGWEFTSDTGWLCPKHVRGSSVRTQESASEAK